MSQNQRDRVMEELHEEAKRVCVEAGVEVLGDADVGNLYDDHHHTRQWIGSGSYGFCYRM